MESGTANLLQMLEDRVKELCHQEKWDEAVHAAETAVRKAREAGEADPSIIDELALSLEVKGDLLRQMGEAEKARQDYREAMELLDGRDGYAEQIGRVSASMAVVGDELGDSKSARKYYEKAIAIFEALDPPAELDIADLSNNLAFLYQAEDNYDEAETLFLRALKISHDILGRDDTETASICNNLGALYQKSGHFERAKEMHLMALDVRTDHFGEDHPDTGQSHANLAVVLAESRALTEAREHFDMALAVFDKHLAEIPEDYETVAYNYAQFLRNLGEPKAAKQLEKKSAKKLRKL